MTAPTLGGPFQNAASSKVSAEPSRAERVQERAERHFEKHRDQWIAKRYETLLKKESPAPALRPSWASDDRKSHLYRAAAFLVDRNLQRRMKIIQAIGAGVDRREKKAGLEL